jgi:hypothetical protein
LHEGCQGALVAKVSDMKHPCAQDKKIISARSAFSLSFVPNAAHDIAPAPDIACSARAIGAAHKAITNMAADNFMRRIFIYLSKSVRPIGVAAQSASGAALTVCPAC